MDGADHPHASGASSPHVRWATGGDARLTALDGERIRLRSTSAFAPGARPSGNLVACERATGAEVRIKVHRCRKVDDGFELEGRLIDATRELRARLAALAAAAPAAT